MRTALLILLLCLPAYSQTTHRRTPPNVQREINRIAGAHSAPKWEYTTLRGYAMNAETQSRLDALGDEGWELVSVVNTGGTEFCIYFLKRPRQ
jgi:hypothetical protein